MSPTLTGNGIFRILLLQKRKKRSVLYMNNKKMSASPQRIYQNARYGILGLILFTILNLVLYFIGSDSYYLFSVFLAYILAVGFENAVGLVLAALVLAPYVLAFFLSKKKRGWLIAALVLFSLDTLILILLGLGSGALLSLTLDLLFHGLVIVLLALGVKNGKAATGEGSGDPYHPADAAADGQTSAPADGDGPFTDVVCVVAVSEDGQKFSLQSEGLVRFFENELAFGMNSMARTLLLGSAFASTQEKVRCAYTDVVRAFYTGKHERNVRFDLAGGQSVIVTLNRGNREQFVNLLAAHGVAIEPFAQ